MFGSTVLEVAIGLIFVYWLLSLFCSAITELVASRIQNLRSRALEAGLRNLLDDPSGKGIAKALYLHPLIRALWPKSPPVSADDKAAPTGSEVSTQSLTKFLPGYIPSRTFALALCDLILPANGQQPVTVQKLRAALDPAMPPGDGGVVSGSGLSAEERRTLSRVVLPLLDDAGEDMKTAREGIEQWFDDSMDRVSGWYKRHSSWVMIVVAAIVAFILNADTVMIVRRLSQDKSLRDSIVKMAEQRVAAENARANDEEESDPHLGDDPPEPMGEGYRRDAKLSRDVASLQGELNTLNLLGWRSPGGWVETAGKQDLGKTVWQAFGGSFLAMVEKILGLLLTVAAVSFGAPFWFDILNKLVNVRGGGPKPQRTDERKEKSK